MPVLAWDTKSQIQSAPTHDVERNMNAQDPSENRQVNKTLVAVLVVCFFLLFLLACATVLPQQQRECLSPQWPFCAPELPIVSINGIALVRGPSHAHVCQFQVSHVHFSAPSQVSQSEQLFSQPAMEEA